MLSMPAYTAAVTKFCVTETVAGQMWFKSANR
jgi:hypothetical protein